MPWANPDAGSLVAFHADRRSFRGGMGERAHKNAACGPAVIAMIAIIRHGEETREPVGKRRAGTLGHASMEASMPMTRAGAAIENGMGGA